MSETKAIYNEKQLVINEISEKFAKAKSAVVIDYMGITVEEANKLRTKLRDANVDYRVYKNTLVKRAIKGTSYESLSDVLEGPSAFAISYEDETAPARVINDSIKEMKKMTFKAGVVDGKVCSSDEVQKLANIPSRDVLIAKFMGSIQSPISKAVRTFKAIADEKA